MKKDSEQNAGNNFNQNSNFTIDVDTSNITDGISSAMQDSLSSMKDALAQSNKQAEENRKAMENLIKLQEAQKENEKIRQQNELARIQKEKEIEAEKKAQEEQRKIQEEKRKAQEEELARKNAETKKLIDSINAEIQKGKTALATGNVDDALMYFKNAEKLLPEVGDKNFVAQKESEIAQALFDAATKEGLIPSEKERLMKEFDWNKKQAQGRITESDENRKGFHKNFFNIEPDNPANYHLTLNTGILTVDESANAIANLCKALITEEKEIAGEKKVQELYQAQLVVNALLFEHKVNVNFLRAVIDGEKLILQGVADSVAISEKAASLAREIMPDKTVESCISIVQDFNTYP
ncbi:MAG: cytidylate kinase family protein, partial [Treponema sp.]|nr:cytidylate kinase family protein [Treponema sp.]